MRTHRMEAVERPHPGLSVLIMEVMLQWVFTTVVYKELGIDQNRMIELCFRWIFSTSECLCLAV